MNTDKLLKMLLEAIDYSFLQTDGSYDKTLTYPVIDKIKYIKEQVKEVNLEKEITRVSKNEYFDFTDWKSIARHFFELGLKAKDK